MNILTSILDREFLQPDGKVNIVWTHTDNDQFKKFIESMGHNFISFESLYYGDHAPHIIICNNKIMYYDEVNTISMRFHLPVLVVDHHIKDKFNQINTQFIKIPSAYTIALNKDISESWGGHYDQILSYDKNNSQSLATWNTLIYNIATGLYTL